MMKMNKSGRIFTLLEVVLAVAILSLGLVAALGLAAGAAKRLGKASRRWQHQHMLTQAAEYYLLAGSKKPIPSELFPYGGYRAECFVDEKPEGLPEGVKTKSGKWILVKVTISIYDPKGKNVASVSLDKIIREKDL